MRYRSIPCEVDAEQWSPGKAVPGVHAEGDRHYVVTIHGQRAYLDPGDYVVTEPDGLHHYPVKPGIFEAKYRPVAAANRIEEALARMRRWAMTDEEVEEMLQ